MQLDTSNVYYLPSRTLKLGKIKYISPCHSPGLILDLTQGSADFYPMLLTTVLICLPSTSYS